MRYAWLLALFVIGVVLAPAVAAQGLSDVAITSVFGIYKANDKYVVYGADSSGNLLLEVLDSSLSPVAAFNLGSVGIKAYTYDAGANTFRFDAILGEGFAAYVNSSDGNLYVVFFNATDNSFYRVVTSVPVNDIVDAELLNASSFVVGASGVVSVMAGDTAIPQVLFIIENISGTLHVYNMTWDFGSSIVTSSTFPTSGSVANVVEGDVVYFAAALEYYDTPAVYYGYYNITSGSGVLKVVNSTRVAELLGVGAFDKTRTYLLVDDGVMHIVVFDSSYGALSYLEVNATSMALLRWAVIYPTVALYPYEARASRFGKFMVIPAFALEQGSTVMSDYFSPLLLDLETLDVYAALVPVGTWAVDGITHHVGGVAFFDNGTFVLLRPSSLDEYLRGCFGNFCIVKAVDGMEELNVTSEVSTYDYSTAIVVEEASGVTASFSSVAPESASLFTVSTESIEYYPETVTKTVSEPVPVPVETTVTSTVTTTVEKPVIGTEALIAILFIMLIVAAAVIMRRR